MPDLTIQKAKLNQNNSTKKRITYLWVVLIPGGVFKTDHKLYKICGMGLLATHQFFREHPIIYLCKKILCVVKFKILF